MRPCQPGADNASVQGHCPYQALALSIVRHACTDAAGPANTGPLITLRRGCTQSAAQVWRRGPASQMRSSAPRMARNLYGSCRGQEKHRQAGRHCIHVPHNGSHARCDMAADAPTALRWCPFCFAASAKLCCPCPHILLAWGRDPLESSPSRERLTSYSRIPSRKMGSHLAISTSLGLSPQEWTPALSCRYVKHTHPCSRQAHARVQKPLPSALSIIELHHHSCVTACLTCLPHSTRFCTAHCCIRTKSMWPMSYMYLQRDSAKLSFSEWFYHQGGLLLMTTSWLSFTNAALTYPADRHPGPQLYPLYVCTSAPSLPPED
jgi:hypothetical protein